MVSLISTSAIVFVGALVATTYYEVRDHVMSIERALRTRLVVTLVGLASSIMLITNNSDPLLLSLPILFVLFISFVWLYPVIKYRGSFVERLKRADEAQTQSELKVIQVIKAHNGQPAFVLAALILFVIAAGHIAGHSFAYKQESFLIIPAAQDSPELVVLKMYDHKLVCATFNRSTREVNHQFTFRDVVPSSGVPDMMRLEKVGPLWSNASE